MLVLQYNIGVFLNLYVPIPASDKGAGMMHEIATAPFALSLHATLGLALIGVAGLLLARTAAARDRALMALASLALVSICGAFVAGETFVSGGGASAAASFAMAALTGVALFCYIGTLALTSLRRRTRIRESYEPDPDSPYVPESAYGPDPAYRPDSPYHPDPAPSYPNYQAGPRARPWEANGTQRPASPPMPAVPSTPASPPRRPSPGRLPRRPPPPRSALSESTLWEPARREWPRPDGAWDRDLDDDPPYRSR